MVKIGDEILINKTEKVEVTSLYQSAHDGRWVIGYLKEHGGVGFFNEGDEDFRIL